jgi:hypothetical protein
MKIGQKFGQLTVIQLQKTKAECSCNCGNKILVDFADLPSKTNCGLCYLRKRGRVKKQFVDNRPERNTDEYKEWRNSVYKRDKYKCICCDTRKRGLNAHHLYGWNTYIHLRYTVSNGVTLCWKCHKHFHTLFGRGSNTREQFIFFLHTYYGRQL